METLLKRTEELYIEMTAADATRVFILSRSASNCRTSTITNYNRYLTDFIKTEHISNIRQITCDAIRDYLAKLSEKGLKGSTIHTRRAMILAWVSWLSEEGKLPETPWQRRIERVKTEVQRVRFLSVDETKQFIWAARTMKHNTQLAAKRDVCMMLLFLDTTCRSGEMLNIKMDDVDLNTRTIRISVGLGRKSREARIVPFGSEAARTLRAYLKVRGGVPSPYLWMTREAERPSRSLMLQIVRRIAKAAGLSSVCVHTLRHTAITLLVRQGVPLPLIQKIAGHARIETTMQYVHLVDEDVKRVYSDNSPLDGLIG